jgi:uncharacterized protein YdaU (DUF1376 family)
MTVQGMSDGAYRGYHNLLMSQWQSEDGTLPTDDGMLARMSGLFSRWKEFKSEILENFVTDGFRYKNVRQSEEWDRARQVSEKKGRRYPESGQSVDAVRPESVQSPSAIRTHARARTDTTTETRTKKDISPKVEKVYAAYPRKVGKNDAFRAIEKALSIAENTNHPWPWLLERTEEFAHSPAGHNGEFTPHPASWFNKGRYFDDPREWRLEHSNGHKPEIKHVYAEVRK